MKVTELRIGNVISTIYNPNKYVVVLALEQGGSVHHSGKDVPDDARDIVGVNISDSLLSYFHLNRNIQIKDFVFNIEFFGKQITVTINNNTHPIKYFHQLQNIVFIYTAQELINSFDWIER